MSLNFLKDFYQNVRNTLLWFVIYFIVQAIVWVALAVLILIYPGALFLLAIIFFFVLAIVSVYFAILFGKYLGKLKKIKEYLTGDFLK